MEFVLTSSIATFNTGVVILQINTTNVEMDIIKILVDDSPSLCTKASHLGQVYLYPFV